MEKFVRINAIFLAALKPFTNNQWGLQTQLAKVARLTPQKMNNILAGSRRSDEDERRAIASELGYEYEQFLNLGRRALGLPEVKTQAPPPRLSEFFRKAVQVLEGPDGEHLKAVAEAFSERIKESAG